MSAFATIDFHVTSRCNQECAYCWGPQDFDDTEVDSKTAAAIVRKIAQSGAQRIVFTGGDPILRPDIGMLIRLAKQEGLEVALSTTGDELTRSFVRGYGSWIDLISLPLDGASEEVSSRTKKEGHFSAIRNCLDFLADFPAIDVKVATPVTLHNIHDIPGIIALLDERAAHMPNHLFYNVFQAYPRAMQPQSWDDLVVSDDDFQALKADVERSPHAFKSIQTTTLSSRLRISKNSFRPQISMRPNTCGTRKAGPRDKGNNLHPIEVCAQTIRRIEKNTDG